MLNKYSIHMNEKLGKKIMKKGSFITAKIK